MRVQFNSSIGNSVVASPLEGERLLHAALRTGANPPYECATGTCGSCVATLVSGTTANLWPEAPGLKALRGGTTQILLCQSKATSDCILEFKEPKSSAPSTKQLPTYSKSTLREISWLSEGLYVVTIACSDPFKPIPGQFLLIGLEGIVGYRAYSVSNVTDNGSLLSFVVRRGSPGGLSYALCDPNSVGRVLNLFGPLGSACIRASDPTEVTLIVGGSGIGVAMSIADHYATTKDPDSYRLNLYVGLRTSNCKPVFEWLETLHRKAPLAFRTRVAFSDDPDIHGSSTAYEVHSGFVHQVALTELYDWSPETVIFVAGPPVMVDSAIQGLLRARRFEMSKVRFDRFS